MSQTGPLTVSKGYQRDLWGVTEREWTSSNCELYTAEYGSMMDLEKKPPSHPELNKCLNLLELSIEPFNLI